MSLARHFTKRSKRPDISLLKPSRSGSVRHGAIQRSLISAPVELKSTTNVLVFSHPDIHPTGSNLSSTSSPSSANSPEDSDLSHTTISTPGTSPEPSVLEKSSSPSSKLPPSLNDDLTHTLSHSSKESNTQSQEYLYQSSSLKHSASTSQGLRHHYESSASKHSTSSSRDLHSQYSSSTHTHSSSRDLQSQYNSANNNSNRPKHAYSSSRDYHDVHVSSPSRGGVSSSHEEIYTQPRSPKHSGSLTRIDYGNNGNQDAIIRDNAPTVPQRAPSHTKREHVLAHQRSISRPSAPANIAANNMNQPQRNADDIFKVDSSHPFGKELEQVREVAEGYGLKSAALGDRSRMMSEDERKDERVMMAKGLRKFAAEEYLVMVQNLYTTILVNDNAATGQTWI